MDKLVKMTFSDGNGNVLREGYVAVTNEFLDQSNVENHSITSPEYVKELKRKAKAFDEIKEIVNSEKLNNNLLYDNDNFIDRLCNVLKHELERGSDE
ncbi:hypothetical protein ACN9U3_03100 [Staphylococcus caprae]|uniref:hypothetical protein n=1 Tax=Staphylococcus caprae TaxID=29380 RepID=UPI003B22184E